MNHKAILADDSLTIQKVIKITLANQPYDITDCKNEDELFAQLPIVQPKLVFLDFNLSEQYTGYELTAKIKSIVPGAKVLLLLGTFDSVDEAAMEKCGASDKIVKPFDSNKFISICKNLVDSFEEGEIPFPEDKKSEFNFENPDDQWTVNHSTEQSFPSAERFPDTITPSSSNPLAKEMSEWGMSVPNIINDKDTHDKVIDLPPIINATPSNPPKTEVKFPENEDLDYPSKEDPSTIKAPKSKFISLDTLNTNDSELEIETSYQSNHESDVSSIEAQIRDEVEENLWQADEFENLKKEVSAKIEEVKSNFQPSRTDFDESLFKPVDDIHSVDWAENSTLFNKPEPTRSGFTVNGISDQQQIEELIKKYVKEYMDQFFQKNVEKIAWEVIPDLAENLIRQELSKISSKILNDQP